jgi:hypothetical protein
VPEEVDPDSFHRCLFPAMTLLLANWYRREELAQRISYLFSKPLHFHSMQQTDASKLRLHCRVLLVDSSLSEFSIWMASPASLDGDGYMSLKAS